MEHKLIPLDLPPIHYEATGNKDHWRGGAKNFFVVNPIKSSLEKTLSKEPAKELRCTIDLLLEVEGKTFYSENRFYRVAHGNKRGINLDFGMATMPGGGSFVNMLYEEQALLKSIGKPSSRFYGTIAGITAWVVPFLWPLLSIKAWRGIPRMDKVISGSVLSTLYPLDQNFLQLARIHLEREYSQEKGMTVQDNGEWLGMGYVLPIPSSFLEDNKYKQYDYRLVHEFVRLPPCPALRR